MRALANLYGMIAIAVAISIAGVGDANDHVLGRVGAVVLWPVFLWEMSEPNTTGESK